MIGMFTIILVLYLFVGIVASGTDIMNGLATGFGHIYSPVSSENGKLMLLYLLSNIAISLASILLLLKRCDQHFSMVCYELKNNKRKKLLFSQKSDLYKCLLAINSAKFMIDLLTLIGMHSFSWNALVSSSISFFMTSALWLETLYTLRLCKVSSNVTLFVVLVCVFFSILLQSSATVTFFAYFKTINEMYDCLLKGILIIILHILEINIIKSADLY